MHRVDDADAGEVRLYCYSEERAKKERGIAERFARRFEQGLSALHEGLSRPRTQKQLDRVWQRIGRMQEKSRGAGQHYDIEVTADESGEKAVSVTWTRKPVDGSMITHPGVYCLRSNAIETSEETLWRTYTLLTDLEAVFRSLKSELGLRPMYHHKPLRAEGHLFITVIAYQLVQVIRKRLAERGPRSCRSARWTTLRRTLAGRQRATANTPAEPAGASVARFPADGSLPRITAGSASALPFSRPARRSLALRPAYSLNRPWRSFSSECFRRCRYLLRPLRLLPAGATIAGRDSHSLRNDAFARRTVNLG